MQSQIKMKSILKLSLILTFLAGCNGGTPSVFSPSYNSVSDFEGEYIAYDEDGKILYGGKHSPRLKNLIMIITLLL